MVARLCIRAKVSDPILGHWSVPFGGALHDLRELDFQMAVIFYDWDVQVFGTILDA